MILIANRRGHRFKSLEVSSRDLAISSICLNESVLTLKAFIKKCLIIDEAEMNRLLGRPTTKLVKSYIVWEDGSILLLLNGNNWEVLNILYSLHSVPKVTHQLYQRVIAFNESRRMEMALYKKTLDDYKIKLTNHILNFYSEQVHYFNAKKLVRLAKVMGINASLNEDKVLFRYKDIEYASAEGSIFYNEIFVFIKDFQIDGFMLRFQDFDFSTYWNIPVVLHPFLAIPYGFNNNLDFLPPQNYQMFAEAINEAVTGKVEGGKTGFKDVRLLIQDFQDLRRIWASNKMRAQERIELSKLILKKKVAYDKT